MIVANNRSASYRVTKPLLTSAGCGSSNSNSDLIYLPESLYLSTSAYPRAPLYPDTRYQTDRPIDTSHNANSLHIPTHPHPRPPNTSSQRSSCNRLNPRPSRRLPRLQNLQILRPRRGPEQRVRMGSCARAVPAIRARDVQYGRVCAAD